MRQPVLGLGFKFSKGQFGSTAKKSSQRSQFTYFSNFSKIRRWRSLIAKRIFSGTGQTGDKVVDKSRFVMAIYPSTFAL